MISVNKSMYAITSSWGPQGQEKETFRLIPVVEECPYQECIFDPMEGILAIISKIPKKSWTMTPRIDDNGDLMMVKTGKRSNGKQYKEERRLMETYTEYYIENPLQIREIINGFCFNASFALQFVERYLESKKEVPPGEVTFAKPMEIVKETTTEATVEVKV